jgi:demethylmenaquinone methyltransferase / 2-methoxy-6-polyprenyl-1,4-benzoquinol methylase
MSEAVQKLFNDIAGKYDFINSLLSFSIDSRWRKEAMETLKSAEIKSVLDLCAGTLGMSLELLKQNEVVNISAVDFSEKMLLNGMRRIPNHLRSRIKVVCGDGLALPFADTKFDGAMCAYGLRNLDDNRAGLKELMRVLKPGGKLVILEFFKPDRFLSRFFQATYGKCVIPIIGRIASRNKMAYSYLRDSVSSYYTILEYEGLLKEAGFQNIKIKRQTGGISTLMTATKGEA